MELLLAAYAYFYYGVGHVVIRFLVSELGAFVLRVLHIY